MDLALVMVTRGEVELAERALASVRPFVDRMVVLALDEDEDAARRLAEAGAEVVPGEWVDDAAACRNAALDAADADVSLVLDPEEYLVEGGERLRELADGHRVGLVEVVRAPAAAAESRHPRHLSARLLPRGVHFEGAYREEAVFDLPAVQAPIVLATDDTESGRWRVDRERNEALMLQALSLQPRDPRLLLEMADELRRSGRYAEAAVRYESALTHAPAGDASRHAMVVGELDCLVKAGLLRDAVALMDEHAADWQHSPDFTYLLGDLFFEMMLVTPQVGVDLAPLVESSWRRCLELGERPDLAGAVRGRGSFLAAQNLYVLNLVLGRGEEAEAWSGRAAAMRVPSSSVGKLLG